MSTNLEPEQKLKLSYQNILSLVTILIAVATGYNAISSRVAVLEKQSEENTERYGKFEFKLDKIYESTNQIKVDIAGYKVIEAENRSKQNN